MLVAEVSGLRSTKSNTNQVFVIRGERRPIGFRSPPDQIPFAVQSDSVRRPIGFRSPPNQIPFAAWIN